jgi:3-phenylpropionate/cinnamic acid dioxygenase small subunit
MAARRFVDGLRGVLMLAVSAIIFGVEVRPAHPQISDGVVRIGVLGNYGSGRDIGGPGSVAAAKPAASEFNNGVLGRPVEIVAADHQNKPDVFLYREADLLDQRRFNDWLNLIADDIVYFMPIRRNVKFGQHEKQENTRAGQGISWFDEGKWTLTKRVEQILTGAHFAEEPLSRVCHMVSNVQILEARPSFEVAEEVVVRSRFLFHQNRVEYEAYTFIGRRTDLLRKIDGNWKIARREIILDENVLLAKNLSIFF